jgi:hypothetical protein
MEQYLLTGLTICFLFLGWWFATGVAKTQLVRIVDVILYGPFLIYLAYKLQQSLKIGEVILLLFIGATTITYNLRNFLALIV